MRFSAHVRLVLNIVDRWAAKIGSLAIFLAMVHEDRRKMNLHHRSLRSKKLFDCLANLVKQCSAEERKILRPAARSWLARCSELVCRSLA